MKGHATLQHVREGTFSLWQLQAKQVSALHPCVAQFEQCCRARASFLCWLAKFLGRLHVHVKFRGWSGVAHAAWEAGGFPTRTAKEESHARFLLEVRVPHRATCERACATDGVVESCRAGVVYSES